jgi:signal peptidase II
LKQIRTYAGLFFIVSVIIALDQWTKWLVRENIPFMGQWLPAGLEWLMPYARIVHWYNTGAAFGSFQGYGWIFTILAFIVAGMIVHYYPKVDPRDWWLRLAMGMQMAGALGNVIDRLMLDWKVTDFISVGTFPVFNVADSSITVGVIILLLGLFWQEYQDKRARQGNLAAETEPGDEQTAESIAETP